MSSSQELYNRLDEKLRGLVHVKNRRRVSNLAVLQKGAGTCVIGLVESGGVPDFGWCDGLWRSLANLSSLLATWLSSHPDRLDDRGRKRFGAGCQVEEHVSESATLFETTCQAGDIISGCGVSRL